MDSIVSTERLSKSFGSVRALDECSLTVAGGQVFGLLGPNGAGKSTLIRLLLGFLKPSSGRATVAGFDTANQSLDVRRNTAYLPGDARLFRAMRGRDVIDFFVSLRSGVAARAHDLARQIDLDTSRRVGWMSTGMRQKLALAVTISAETPLLILDEPTANLDPTARGTVLEWVRECRDQGRTVVFSSHVMSEIEQTCNDVVILRSGHLVHRQEMSKLRQQHRIRAQLRRPIHELPEGLRRLNENEHELLAETETELSGILQWLASIEVDSVEIEPVGLSSIYKKYHSAQHSTETPIASSLQSDKEEDGATR
jgi:ABC-2 type transport system ATP-binding protein